MYQYSQPIPVSEVRKLGSFTILPARRNVCCPDNNDIEFELIELWDKEIGDNTTRFFRGCRNAVTGSFDTLGFPEAIPERLRFCTWMVHFFTLFDGKILQSAGS